MKKKVVSILLVGAMAVAMTACGSSSDSGTTTGGDTSTAAGDEAAATGEASEAPATSDDPNTLTIWAWDPEFNIPAIEAAVAAYQEKNPDFECEIVTQSGSSDIETAITNAASAGNYSTLPDIVLFQDHYIKNYVANYPDAWQNVDDTDINWDDFSAEKIDYSTIDGVHYGVPVDAGTCIAAYRVDLLEESGYTIDDLTGVTWDEFIEIGKKVKETTGKYLLCMDGDGNDLVYIMCQAEGVSQFKDGAPYIVDNEVLNQVVEKIVQMSQEGVLTLANSWSDYTDATIQGDQVAGIINGNWIIPTMELVEANSGKWEITSLPTLSGEEGYASNGGSSLYITANCAADKVDLAKDFLAYTFGGGEGATATYDAALTDGGVVSTYLPAADSDVYNEGVDFFNGTAIYAQIAKMTANVPVIEQSDYHYTARQQMAPAIMNIINGSDQASELQTAEDQLNFAMGN